MRKLEGKKKVIAAAALAGVIVIVLVVVKVVNASSGAYREIMPEVRNISTYLEFSGNVETSADASVYAQVSAKVLEVKVEKGDEVKAGDVIAVLDTTDAEYEISLKETKLKESEITDSYNVSENKTALAQYTQGIQNGLDSNMNSVQKSLLSAQEEYRNAAEDYNQAKADLEAGKTSSVVSARQTLEAQSASWQSAVEQEENGMMTEEALQTYRISYESAQESYDLALETAKLEVEDCHIAMEQAAQALAEAENDYETGALCAEQDLETYEEKLEKAKALSGEESTKLELAHLKESLQDYVICAPMDGIITGLNIKEGDYTSAGTGSIAEIADFTTMQIAVKIDEQDISGVKTGDPVSIYINALDKTYDGRISRISNTATIDNSTVFVDAVVEFDADEKIRSSFSAEVKLIKAQADKAVCVPTDVILYDVDHTAYIYVKDADGKPQKRQIALGIADGSFIQVTDGLLKEETVLTQTTDTIPDHTGSEASFVSVG